MTAPDEKPEAAPDSTPRAKPVMVRVTSIVAPWFGEPANDVEFDVSIFSQAFEVESDE